MLPSEVAVSLPTAPAPVNRRGRSRPRRPAGPSTRLPVEGGCYAPVVSRRMSAPGPIDPTRTLTLSSSGGTTLHAEVDEEVRDLVGRRVDLGVRQAEVAEHQRLALGVSAGGVLEEDREVVHGGLPPGRAYG